MNFRVNLAVAFAAALSFACADKQAAIPELEEALVAPPGQRVVGLYKMTVTPVEGAEGTQYAWQAIPIGRDGVPTTNPGNTIQVNGTFGQVTTAGPGGCAGIPALTAAVKITNFMVDPLRNVWADVVSMSGNTANTACNSTSRIQPGGNNFLASDSLEGIWRYNDLAGAPNSAGTVAGGESVPVALSGGVWGFRRVTLTAFAFYFRVLADDQSPTLAFTDPAGPNQPLLWTSAVAANSNLEICSADLNFAAKGDPCPVALLVNQPVAGTGAGPWSFSYAPTGLTPGATYYWRARNVYPAGTSTLVAPWIPFTYNGALPAVTNATFAANLPAAFGAIAELTWTTTAVQTDTWVVICDGPCPATRPNAAILVDQPVTWNFVPDVVSNYSLDVLGILAPDPVTGLYFDPAIAYDWRVYDYDGVSGAPALTSAHSVGTITITPVSIAPNITSQPASYSLAAGTWPVNWTADPVFTTTVVDVCSPDCATGVVYAAGLVVPETIPGSATYTLDLFTVLVTNAGANPVVPTDLIEFTISNPDLVGTWGTTVTGAAVVP